MHKRTMTLLALSTLLLGANGVDLTVDDLPACAPNTYLVYRSGKVICEATLPDCKGQLLHAERGGSVAALRCIPKVQDSLSETERQRVKALQAQEQSILARLDALGITAMPGAGFIGLTKSTTTGRIEYLGKAAGLPSANAMCAAELGFGAHMCAVREMFSSVVAGTLNQDADVAKGWLYMPTWNTPTPSPEQPLAGLADNCSGYTDAANDHLASGMAVSWMVVARTGVRTLYFSSGEASLCSSRLPIVCCR